MSAVADPSPAAPTVYRREVTYVVLPADLARLHPELTKWFGADAEVEVVVERRVAGPDRRAELGAAPSGVERRQGDRRSREGQLSVAGAGVELPWQADRHAARMHCVRRGVPVHQRDAVLEADELFVRATAGDPGAREELRLRFHPWVTAMVSPIVGRRRALATTERIFDEAFANPSGAVELRPALTRARERVLSH